MSSIAKRFREALSRPVPHGEAASEKGGVHTPFTSTLHSLAEARGLTSSPTEKIQPAIAFSDVLAAYFADPACKAASHELAFSTVGKGFYHTVDPTYEKADEVEKLIDEFNEKANLDALLIVAAVEVAAAGNHFWFIPNLKKKGKLLDAEQPIIPIPITSIESIEGSYLDPQVKIISKIKSYNLWSTWGGGKLNSETVMHWRWNPINSSVFGYGIIQTLLEEAKISNGETRSSYLEMKWTIEQQSLEIHKKYAGPDQLWILPNAKETDASNLKALIKSKPKEGARFVFGGKAVEGADIKNATIDPRAAFSYIVDHIMNQNYLGLETPLAKALTTPGFTEASIRGAIELHEPVVFSLQRLGKRFVEKLWRTIIAEAGYDPVAAHARLNWGPPSAPDMDQLATLMPNFVRLIELKVIEPPQMREILRTIFNLKMIEEPKKPSPETAGAE